MASRDPPIGRLAFPDFNAEPVLNHRLHFGTLRQLPRSLLQTRLPFTESATLRLFPREMCRSFRLAFRLEIDSELLALFVEVAALEAQGARGVGHVVMMAAQLGEEHFPLEGFQALGQRSASRCE